MSKGEMTKKYIVEKSSSLFNKSGYKSTSISEIMSATGLKKGGIYNHFENKDVLAKESFYYAMNKLKNNYKQAVASKVSASEQFDAFISVFSCLFEDEIIEGGCPLMNAAIEADDTKINFGDSIMYGFEGLIKIIQQIITHGKTQNEIVNDLEDEELAIFILSSLEGALALSRLFQNEMYLKLVIKQLKTILFK